MLLQILGAGLIAFLISRLFGKRYIPWLEKNNIIQPIKEEVTKLRSENEENPEQENPDRREH